MIKLLIMAVTGAILIPYTLNSNFLIRIGSRLGIGTIFVIGIFPLIKWYIS